MKRVSENVDWKATDSSPVDTKQKNDIGVRNQTTQSKEQKNPVFTIVLAIVMVLIVAGIYMAISTSAS